MAVNQRFIKERLAITAGDWTPVTAPSDVDYFAVRCDAAALKIRTTVGDANTEDTIPAGVQDGVIGTNYPNYTSIERARFRQGDIACYIQSSSGSQTAVVTWVL